MKKIIRKSIAILLVLTMLMACVSVAFANTKVKEDIFYLAIGDSYSNGYRFESLENNDLSKTYVNQFGSYLESLGFNSVTVSSSLCQPGFRANDALAYLDMNTYETGDSKPVGDTLTNYWQAWNFDNIPQCIEDAKNADVVTIKLGYNNLVSYVRLALEQDLGMGSRPYLTEKVEDLFTDEQKEKIEIVKKDVTDIIEDAIPAELLEALNTEISSLLDTKVGSTYTVADYINYVSYAILGACIDYDKLLDRLYELSPDVDIYVLGLENPFENIKLTYTYQGVEIDIPIGKAFGSVLELFNLYYSVLSKYSDKVYYVNIIDDPQMMGDKLITDFDYARQFTDVLLDEDFDINDEDRPALVEGIYPNIQYYLSINEFSLNEIISDIQAIGTNGIADLFSDEHIYNLMTEFSSSSMDRFVSKFYLMVFAIGGAACHPSAEGHTTMAESLEKTYSERRLLDEAVVYHFIVDNIPEEAVEFLYAKTLDEVRTLVNEYNTKFSTVKEFIDKLKQPITGVQSLLPTPTKLLSAKSNSVSIASPKTVVRTLVSKIASTIKKMIK